MMKAFSFLTILESLSKKLSILRTKMHSDDLRVDYGTITRLLRVSRPFSRTSFALSRRASHFAAILTILFTVGVGSVWGAGTTPKRIESGDQYFGAYKEAKTNLNSNDWVTTFGYPGSETSTYTAPSGWLSGAEKEDGYGYMRVQSGKTVTFTVTNITSVSILGAANSDSRTINLSVKASGKEVGNVASQSGTSIQVITYASELDPTKTYSVTVSASTANNAKFYQIKFVGSTSSSGGGDATTPVTGVSLNKTTTTLEIGGTETLTATITPNNATNKNVTWSSSNPSVATVDANGLVTAVAVGTATITVTTADGSKTATCAVTVNAASGGGGYPEGYIYITDIKETPEKYNTETVNVTQSDGNYNPDLNSNFEHDGYSNWFKTSSGSGYYQLTFTSQMDLSGYTDVKLDLWWGVDNNNNRGVEVYINGTKIGNATADSKTRYTLLTLSDLSITASSINTLKIKGASGGGSVFFRVGIKGTPKSTDPETYSINYECDGATSGCPNATEQIALPDPLPSAPTKTGYTFVGWYTDAEKTTQAVAGATLTADITLYAKWTPIEYTITYNGLEGATHSNPETYTIESETITFTDPSERTGYTFAGWNPTSIEQGSTGNKTVTASWTINSYTLTYNCDGATSGCPENTQATNLPNPLPSTITKTNFVFEGWYTDEAKTIPAVAGAALTGNTTLYAKWADMDIINEDVCWNISDDAFKDLTTIATRTEVNNLHIVGASNANITVDNEGPTTIDDIDFTRRLKYGGPGSPFARHLWFSVKGDCAITIYMITANNSETRHLALATGSFANIVTSFEAIGDGKNTKGQKVTYNYTGDATTIYLYPSDKGVNIYQICVKYPVPTYTVTYETNGGSAVAQGTKLTALPNPLPTPTKTGYTFVDWYTDAEFNTLAVAGAALSANITLYAKWTCATPTISTQPINATYTQNTAAAALSVTATANDGTLSYQWQKSTDNSEFTNISGATGNEYTPSTTEVGTTYYRCVVTNTTGGCSVTSASATITVTAASVDPEPGACVTLAQGTKNNENTAIVATIGTITTEGGQNSDGYVKLSGDDKYFQVKAKSGSIKAGDKLTVTMYNKSSSDKSIGFKISGTAHTQNIAAEQEGDIVYVLQESDIVDGSVNLTCTSSDDRYKAILLERCTSTDDPEPGSYTINYNLGPEKWATGYTPASTYTAGTEHILPTIDNLTNENNGTFQGWYESADFQGNKVTTIPADATGDKTYYAKWVYDIQFFEVVDETTDVQNKEFKKQLTDASYPTTYTYGKGITLPDPPAKDGYTEAGWYSQWCVCSQETNGLGWVDACKLTALDNEAYGDVNFAVKYTATDDPEPSGCITITDFDKAQKTSANEKPDANSRYLYGYTSSEQPYAITTTSTNNDGGTGNGAYIRLDHNSTINIYSNQASTTTVAEGFADITSISLKIKLKKSAPTITIKVGKTTIANAVSLNGAKTDDFVTFTYSCPSKLDGAVSIKNNNASSSDYNIYIDDIEICTDAILYTVTFNPAEGTVDPSSIQTASTITLPAPIRDDYTFTGWYTAATGGDKVGDAGESYTPTADITLYAQWVEKTTYNIVYELNGANWVNAGAATYEINTGYTLPTSNDLSNYGYTFVGWYDNAECTGTAVTDIPSGFTGDKTFYAKWEQEIFSITYELNSGTNPTGAKSSYTMFDDDYDLPTPTRDNHTFIGWFSDEACTQGPITILPSGSTGDKTFYAKWGNTLTEKWTITKIDEKLQRGGGNYTVTVCLNNAGWDESGNKDDLELTVTEGVILRNIEKTINTDGKAQVTAIFDITTNLAVDAETITFKLSVPTAGNYAAAEFTHSENLDDCAAGSPTEISIFKGTADGDETNTSDAEKYKQNKTWTHTGTGLKNTSKGVKDGLFEITKWNNNAKVNGVTYVRGIQQGGSDADKNHFKLEIPETYTASIYIVYAVSVQSGYFSLGTTLDTPTEAIQTDELWHGVVSSSNKVHAATINNIQPGTYYLLGNSNKCIFAEIKVTMTPTTGGADVNLTWDTTDNLTETIEKGVGEPDFVYTATTTSNTLGTITYSSSDESVATVNQTTGLVDIHAAGTTTITATLASSGCYAEKSIFYKVEVPDNCTDVAGNIVYGDGTSIENNTITKACNDEVVLKLVGHTQQDGITYQWYKNGEVIGGATDVTYTIPSDDEGSYYVVSTNSGEMGNCSMTSNNTIEVKKQGELTVTKLIDNWYVKNNRRTPDIALAQTKNATKFEIKSGENIIEKIGGCTFYLGEDGIIYLKGKQDDGSAPSGMTAGDIILSIAVSDACENSKSIEITIHIQAATERPSIAFVVDGTQGGEFSDANENHSTNSSLYKYLHYDAETNTTGKFDLTACNIYSTTDEKLIREHYSQFDAILVTDDPSTKIPKDNYETRGYVNAFGTMIDIRPILTMEAYVSALANWSCVKGEPSSPNPRQNTIKLECKDHEIYGTGLPAPKEGTNVWDEVDAETGEVYRYVTIVDKTKSPYTDLADDADTHNTPALQGFNSEDVGDLLGLGRISNNTLHAAVERQQVPEARLLLFGIQNKALPNALTDEGKQVIANILTYLLKTNMEEVDDCSNFFVGGDAEDETAWTNENNWAKSNLPTSETKVRILAPCVITNTIAKVAQIDIATSGNSEKKKNKVGNGECNGSLTISPDAALVVEGAIKTAVAPNFGALSPTTSEDLTVESDATGNGALILNNERGDTKATVAMYSKAKAGTGTTWQYIGTPHSDVQNATYNYYNSWIYSWNPSAGWEVVPTGGAVYPWVGYCITHPITHPEQGHTYWMEGTLVETTAQEIEVPSNSYQIIGNSWTAPIQIANFEEEDFENIETKSIYLFNTGTDPEGNNDFTTNDTDEARYAAGTYIVVPINAADYTDDVTHIPSMQGFYVANNSQTNVGTLHLDYDKLVRPKSGQSAISGPMHTPARRVAANDEPQVAKLLVRGKRYDDKLILLEREDFTRGYDSGWDGDKWDGGPIPPTIWAVNEFGGADAVSAIPEYEGTLIAFRAGEDSEYTIHFDYDGMEDALYLLDTDTQIYTRVLKGNSYTFTCADKAEHNRFILTRKAPQIATGTDHINTGENAKAVKFIKDDKIFIFVNGTLYDATGKMVIR